MLQLPLEPHPQNDIDWMRLAIVLAQHAEGQGEVPVGALIVHNNELIGSGHNLPIQLNDPTAHAEMLALREAGARRKDYRLTDATLYVTLEPCPMCMSAIIHSRVARVVFGAYDPRQGAVCSQIDIKTLNPLHHPIDAFGGVLMEECGALIRDFFKQKR